MSDAEDVAELIDHSRLTDGFGELSQFRAYVQLSTFCGICDASIIVSPREQKYLLEERAVPVKRLRAGAAFCHPCAVRRARINVLARGERWRHEPHGASELEELRSAERDAQNRSQKRFLQAEWPYVAR